MLEQLRAQIKAAAPDADEVISYKMPAFKWQGKLLVSYDAFKEHFSLFPASEGVRRALGAEIEPYLSGKGTIRFTLDMPLSPRMVKGIVKARLEEIASGKR